MKLRVYAKGRGRCCGLRLYCPDPLLNFCHVVSFQLLSILLVSGMCRMKEHQTGKRLFLPKQSHPVKV
jgi:hypothetical protein